MLLRYFSLVVQHFVLGCYISSFLLAAFFSFLALVHRIFIHMQYFARFSKSFLTLVMRTDLATPHPTHPDLTTAVKEIR